MITGIQGAVITQIDMLLPMGKTRKRIQVSTPGIAAESTRSLTAELGLTTNINTEVGDRKAADVILDDRITAIVDGLSTPLVPADIAGTQGIIVSQIDMLLPFGQTRKTIRISAPGIAIESTRALEAEYKLSQRMISETIIEGKIEPSVGWIDETGGASTYKLVRQGSLVMASFRNVSMTCTVADGSLLLCTVPDDLVNIYGLQTIEYCHVNITRGNTIARDSLMQITSSPAQIWINYSSPNSFLGANVSFETVSMHFII